MAYQVIWSLEAVKDAEEIAEFIARDSRFYARSVVEKIIQSSRELRDMPFAGRVVPELDDKSIRERFVYSYRLIYKVRDNSVTIVAVIHGKRLLEAVEDRWQ